ncbi:hypothetical protein F0562_027099 [Nyssa sinensis]|uniref:Uncharacterized protein n=1 Tax=Nyssa sinensis TaxID=561372 RepID=A0A5J5B8G8_9ASTE|nr:hypothetical protein F0562_027099 [Nyssa sinensis]
MEPVASVVDKLKGFAKSFKDFANDVFQWRHNSSRRSRIEILKWLQREAFSDLMKLRDRQDTMERMLSFYKSSKGGIRTGIQSRFTFESTIRHNDNLLVEFVASEKGQGDVLGSPLSLAKVFYEANISDGFSAVAIPVGAQRRDVGVATNSASQRRGLTNYSSFGPPVLNQPNGSAIGLMHFCASCLSAFKKYKTLSLGRKPMA